ncbi:hypothetical protein [Streptomyces sp. 5-10]|uniref:hypothetical protein n=1 Tax=Streptomyces sp. 5-10 TaxID=878925 RepID=UPI00168AAA30|nr:hypothetical protein [Streptomyces sp. 5-10]MBD3003452.1 hypothetical protein [Streptomyces sp. 5-10]
MPLALDPLDAAEPLTADRAVGGVLLVLFAGTGPLTGFALIGFALTGLALTGLALIGPPGAKGSAK